ncbi:MAG: ATP-binding protein [Patescibacteria group bacterium]
MIFNRNILELARKYLYSEETLIFTGARQVGKTVILKTLKSDLEKKGEKTYFFNLEDPDYLKLLDESPKNLFKIVPFSNNIKTYVFIDEIQYLAKPTTFIKYIFDEHSSKIKLIVSGSSAFYLDKKFKDSLAGRKKIFDVRTLSFREFLYFKGQNKFLNLDFNKLSLIETDGLKMSFEEFVIYGGYPKVVLTEDTNEKIEILRELAYSYIKKDIYEAGIKQEDNFYRFFKILSMQVGNLVNSSELANGLGISKTAVDNYLYVMEKSFHISRVKPLFKNVRKELIKMPKIHFLDLGLRNFFANNFSQFEFRTDKGMFFENIIYKLLLDKYGKDEIKFWRTQDGKEIDFVLDEQKIAFEAKAKFRKNKFKIFKENYPEIKVNTIAFEDCWKILA